MRGNRLRGSQPVQRIVREILRARGIQYVGDGRDVAVLAEKLTAEKPHA